MIINIRITTQSMRLILAIIFSALMYSSIFLINDGSNRPSFFSLFSMFGLFTSSRLSFPQYKLTKSIL